MDRLRVRQRPVVTEPVVQAGVIAFLALVTAQMGDVAGWFAVALLAGVSLSGSL